MADESFVFYFPSYAPTVPPDDVDSSSILGGFGTGPFGSMPFGSAHSIPAPSLSILYVEAVAVDTVRIHLSLDAVVNAAYKDVHSYSIKDPNGVPVEIRGVMWPRASDAYPYVQLHVRNLIEGQMYTVGAVNLLSRKGYGIEGTSTHLVYARTKVDSAVQSMPTIYDTRAEANLRAMLTAIGYEDNIVAGSPDGIEENV